MCLDGTKLATIHHPVVLEDGDLELALYGSFLPVPKLELFKRPIHEEEALKESPPVNEDDKEIYKMPPGHLIAKQATDLILNHGRPITQITVTNLADRPIQGNYCASYCTLLLILELIGGKFKFFFSEETFQRLNSITK